MAEYDKAVKSPVAGGGCGYYVIGQEEIDAVTALLRTPEKLFRYSSDGQTQSNLLEAEACAKTGAKHALFVNSGTSALACCLSGLGIGPGDEVIVQAYTYIATVSACIEVGAVPVIAEIDSSLSLDPLDVEKKITPYTKAVIITHMQGVPGQLDAVRAVAKKHGLFMVEDCCQAIGAKYKGKYVGVDSDVFAWSLNYFKNITCGEGGIFFTSSDRFYTGAFYQSDPAGDMWQSGLGKSDSTVHAFTRSCYRGNEMSACVARVQLGKLDSIMEKTRFLKKTLLDNLASPVNYIRQQVDDPEGDCGISFAMIVKDKDTCARFVEGLSREGLFSGAAYNSALPDRHIFCYWDALMDNGLSNTRCAPWKDPLYKGTAHYTKDVCPRSLDILSRTVRIGIHLGHTEQNMKEFAEAINKVDASL